MSEIDLNYIDDGWQDKYRDMMATPIEAVRRIRPGQRVLIATGCSEPVELVRALTDRAGELADVEIVQLLAKGDAPYASRQITRLFFSPTSRESLSPASCRSTLFSSR
jgi:acyl-CoA hydrolase